MNKKRLDEFLRKAGTLDLATSDNGQPHVRCMAAVYHEKSLWCCTKTERKKVQELKQNNLIEICIIVKGEQDLGSIRGSGKAVIITDPHLREELAERIPFFKAYWKTPQDLDFTLIKLEIDSFILHDPDDKQFYTIST